MYLLPLKKIICLVVKRGGGVPVPEYPNPSSDPKMAVEP